MGRSVNVGASLWSIQMVWQSDKANWTRAQTPTSISWWLSTLAFTRLQSQRFKSTRPKSNHLHRAHLLEWQQSELVSNDQLWKSWLWLRMAGHNTGIWSCVLRLMVTGGVNIANDQVISSKRDFSVCIGKVWSEKCDMGKMCVQVQWFHTQTL